MHRQFLLFSLFCLILVSCSQEHVNESNAETTGKLIPVAEGYANTSVNAVIFRKHSLFTHNGNQYISFYDADGRVVLGKRASDSSEWELHQTNFTGNVEDAHNSISMAVDGRGYIHLAWDHHNNPLNYAVSLEPENLEMSQKQRPGSLNTGHSVTYPEFYRMPGGDLLLMYRNGWSGKGSQVVHRFDLDSKEWQLLHEQLIDGEGEVNPFWQTTMDAQGTFHLSWTWRRDGIAETNHNLMYARSHDGGLTWERSDGTPYQLPITPKTAEMALEIPDNSSMMNQTSMAADRFGRPYIVNYWTPEGSDIPQYHVVYLHDWEWNVRQVSNRTEPFELSGRGTMAPPLSRPQIVTQSFDDRDGAIILFRDEEHGNRVSAAVSKDIEKGEWQIVDLADMSVGNWEPTFDLQLWRESKILNLLVQRVAQLDNEQPEKIGPQMVYVLEWNPFNE
ncbi:BNR repeat-containing protein [Rhodohalobacter sp. 8-1]|uniref:BNR repeat-containing protein n=1 Tax=Rhodohalobacter sp. 8-1 TaxID=3131972 RepID=UPI0030EC7EB8